MPRIDYRAVRRLVSMERVLELMGFAPVSRRGAQLRGPCPLHSPRSRRGREFSAHLEKGAFQCFRCGARGNQLDLWAAYRRLPLREAACDLCQTVGLPTPSHHG